MTLTIPLRLMILQSLHLFFTDALTFMFHLEFLFYLNPAICFLMAYLFVSNPFLPSFAVQDLGFILTYKQYAPGSDHKGTVPQ